MRKHSTGFTLIELTLAMTFISVLLLAIVMTAIQAGRTYNKGIVLQSVNQSGTHISDTLRRDFLQADARRIALEPTGTTGAVISLRGGGTEKGGRFCLGDYSYVWNTPDVVNKLPPDLTGVTTIQTPSGPGEPINFVRVIDPGGNLCIPNGVGAYPTQLNGANVTHLLKPKATSTSEVVLAIHQMTVVPAVQQTNPDGTVSRDSLYAVSFVLGTSETGEINTEDQSCKPPNDTEANDEFCAINKFEMIARTNG